VASIPKTGCKMFGLNKKAVERHKHQNEWDTCNTELFHRDRQLKMEKLNTILLACLQMS
jgi:hypothetical protein